jgi:multiple sugar transport system substrate-binding protein
LSRRSWRRPGKTDAAKSKERGEKSLRFFVDAIITPMKEIVFSTMNIVPRAGLEADFFDSFTRQQQIQVKPLPIDWGDAWNELVRFGLSAQGPDISEIGTTWLGGLHSMDAIRPFTPLEASLLRGGDLFQPAMWDVCHIGRTLLAVPLIMDMRVVLYRRDWLEKAGVAESDAFADADHFSHTLQQIKKSGHPSPLGLATFQSHARLIHDMASWVWSAGGEIRSNDGHRMLLMDAAGRAGMRDYFALNQFISPEMQAMTEIDVFNTFFAGKCAVAILPERNYLEVVMHRSFVNPEVVDNVGLAMLLKVPYIGGSALSIWRHASNPQEAIKLVQYLTSMEAWQVLNQKHLPFTPARLDALAQAPLAATPFYPEIQKSLKNARSFQSGFRWSAVESRLVAVIEQLWADLRANANLNLEHEIEKRFLPVCKRLEQTILVPSS